MLDDYMWLDKLQEGQISVNPVPVNLSQMIGETVSCLKDKLKPKQTIQINVLCPPTNYLDPSLFQKILIGLLSNAINYSGPGSLINVQLTCHGNQLTLSVQDQGIGIVQEDQKHLFNRFYKVIKAGEIESKEIGLPLVSRYVELMGGRIDLSNELTIGTTVTVTLPA